MGKILPIILVVIGLGGGVGAGLFLRPAPEIAEMEEHAAVDECMMDESSDSHGEPADDGHGATADDGHGAPVDDHADGPECDEHAEEETAHAPAAPAGDDGGHGGAAEVSGVQYVKLSKQFVVPVVADEKVAALVVMSLSIEIDASMMETVFLVEPKLRDALLRVMFLHANSGGFDGQFTGGEPMRDLRGSLREAARRVLGDSVSAVLVTDILRQDV